MKYLPFESITYKTKLSSDEIIKRIQDNLEPEEESFKLVEIFKSNNRKPYTGVVHKLSFNMIRIIDYRNSFLLIITGRIENHGNTTKIIIRMRLHDLIYAFIAVWCGGVGLALIFFLISAFKQETFDPSIFIPFGMLMFGYGLAMGGFKYESSKSKKYLAQLFEAEIE